MASACTTTALPADLNMLRRRPPQYKARRSKPQNHMLRGRNPDNRAVLHPCLQATAPDAPRKRHRKQRPSVSNWSAVATAQCQSYARRTAEIRTAACVQFPRPPCRSLAVVKLKKSPQDINFTIDNTTVALPLPCRNAATSAKMVSATQPRQARRKTLAL